MYIQSKIIKHHDIFYLFHTLNIRKASQNKDAT